MGIFDSLLSKTPSEIYEAASNFDLSGSIDDIMNGASKITTGQIVDAGAKVYTAVSDKASDTNTVPVADNKTVGSNDSMITPNGTVFNYTTLIIISVAALGLFLILKKR